MVQSAMTIMRIVVTMVMIMMMMMMMTSADNAVFVNKRVRHNRVSTTIHVCLDIDPLIVIPMYCIYGEVFQQRKQ